MLGHSHIALGHYLIDQYLPHLSGRYKTAFLLGCIQPDKNPTTYLKGSIRCQWLRGHNFANARPFMQQISRRLEKKNRLNLFDYYTLGKLIHYTADAFTAAHNDFFPKDLRLHRQYEQLLQDHFLKYLQSTPMPQVRCGRTIIDSIADQHHAYLRKDAAIQRDAQFVLQACCCVLAILLTPRII